MHARTVTAGKLRNRVTIQARGATQDAAGGPADPWATIASNVPAAIDSLNARELQAAQATMPEATHVITMRYHSRWASPIVGAQYRILFRARIFNLSPPRNTEERNVEVKILATEGLNDG